MTENPEIKIIKEQIKLEKIRQNKKTKRIKWFILGFIFGLFLCIGSYFCIKNDIIKSQVIINKNNILSVDVKEDNNKLYLISHRIKELGDLITAEIESQYVLEYKDDNSAKWHSFFTSKEILLLYTAKISAGIDLTKATVISNDNKVLVQIPKATIKYTNIKPESIKVYDTKLALPLVSIDDNELLLDALDKAYEYTNKSVNKTNILDLAQNQAKVIIEQLIKSIDEKYIIDIETINLATDSYIY